MKLNKKYFLYALAIWLVGTQSFALEHAIEHKFEGHQEACSICLDAAQFSNIDTPPEQAIPVPPITSVLIFSFETSITIQLSDTNYASRAPPFIS